ncbi:hypothetical protein SEA_GILGAMESH_146 [Streptomyces phage Gilgamesh]|uniref:Uncharacterized protein n=1 Tax=Streptomyces phage Gilgamesh TaxID=2599890 RepID=A0A5J6TSI1_9CAUD|nr:hypothetical protein QEH35_gp146 [Streptomyces phage Gilgamesh]QFG13338.1 hypothetical protein SEA_GILGAMESH_146 [Streptomyces phage Gilgamesh]
MTYIPLTRCAALASQARTMNRPHRITRPTVSTVELAHRLLNMPSDDRLTHVAALDDEDLLAVMVALDLHTGSPYELWRDTPSGFAEDVLGLVLDEDLRAVLDVVAGEDVRRVAARVPTSDNHTAAAVLLAWAALVSSRPFGDTPRVAVSFAQYLATAASVWRILARFIDNARLPGRLDMARYAWWADDLEGPQRVMAFAVWNTTPDAMAALHQFVAVVAEADRIADPEMRATMNFLADSTFGPSRFVALGGTTNEPEEWFELYESCDQVATPAGAQ